MPRRSSLAATAEGYGRPEASDLGEGPRAVSAAMVRLRLALVCALGVLYVTPQAAAGGGWWSSIHVDRAPVAPGQRVELDATIAFSSNAAARAAQRAGRFSVYVLRGFDDSALERAMRKRSPGDWWSLGGAEAIRVGPVTIGGLDANLARATAAFTLPEIPPATYHLMLCDAGCTEPLMDVIPTGGFTVVADPATARMAKRVKPPGAPDPEAGSVSSPRRAPTVRRRSAQRGRRARRCGSSRPACRLLGRRARTRGRRTPAGCRRAARSRSGPARPSRPPRRPAQRTPAASSAGPIRSATAMRPEAGWSGGADQGVSRARCARESRSIDGAHTTRSHHEHHSARLPPPRRRSPTVAPVPMRFEVTTLPVADVDRAKAFYQRLGWRLDIDFKPSPDTRGVQFTPPGSPASIQFGEGTTTMHRAVAGPAAGRR